MSLSILRDPRIRAISWRDLRQLSFIERSIDLTLFLPWLLLSFGAAHTSHHLPALACSFLFFLTGLRLVHDVFHANLGLSKRGDHFIMLLLSTLMLGSMHAVRYNHLRHHSHCMGPEDMEAKSAHMSAAKAIVWGPLFPFVLHKQAWVGGDRSLRRWIAAELAITILLVGLCAGPIPVLRYHVAAMAVGQCLTAFFAVWTVHHGCDREHYIARTLRKKLPSAMLYHMFYHVEHHLFPRVPTRHLPRLAERLDRVAPELQNYQVF